MESDEKGVMRRVQKLLTSVLHLKIVDVEQLDTSFVVDLYFGPNSMPLTVGSRVVATTDKLATPEGQCPYWVTQSLSERNRSILDHGSHTVARYEIVKAVPCPICSRRGSMGCTANHGFANVVLIGHDRPARGVAFNGNPEFLGALRRLLPDATLKPLSSVSEALEGWYLLCQSEEEYFQALSFTVQHAGG